MCPISTGPNLGAGSHDIHTTAPLQTFGVNAMLEVKASQWVLADNCDLSQKNTPSQSDGIAALGGRVWFSNGTIRPALDTTYNLYTGGSAIVLSTSAPSAELYVSNSELRGGDAFPVGCWSSEAGHAIRIESNTNPSTVIAKLVGGPASNIQGGNAALGSSCSLFPGPGAGLRVENSAKAVYTTLMPLASGLDQQGLTTPPVQLWGTSPEAFAVDVRYPVLDATVPAVTPGGTIGVIVDGNPGARHLLFASPQLSPTPIAVPGIDGALALAPHLAWLATSILLPPSGHATMPIAVPAAAGLSGLVMRLQSIEVGAPQLAFSNPLPFVIL